MRSFLASRSLRSIGVMVALIVITFVLARAFADPVSIILPIHATDTQRAALRASLGLDQPLYAQFIDYVSGMLRGDFGNSTWANRPALEMVMSRLPASALLASVAGLIALVIGLPIGLIAGLRPGSLADRVANAFTAFSVAAPDFWVGIVLILIFSVRFGLLPTSGIGGPEHLVLPAVTLALRPAGRLAQVTRESVLSEMRRDYVLAAQARGLTIVPILRRHVLKNISVATTTMLGYDLLLMFAGYAAVETVFGWPGIGLLAVQAVINQDVVLVSATVLITGLIITVGNTLVDLAHVGIDRRLAASAS